MESHFKVLTYEGVHPVIHHQHRAIRRIEHSEVEHRPQKVMMRAKRLCPLLKLYCPMFLILMKGVFPFKQEFQLIITIKLEPKHTHEVQIKFAQVPEIRVLMLLDLYGHVVHHAEWVTAKKVLDFDKVNQVVQQRRFQGQLCLFKDVILV